MGSVTVFTAERMKEIEDTTVVSGTVNDDHHLILEQRDGTEIDAGDISASVEVSGEDSTTVDVTVSGSGSDNTPFIVKADVKPLSATIIDRDTLTPAVIPDMFVPALLDPHYVGPGPARVQFLSGGSLSTESYQWIGKYEPWGNRVVTMVRLGASWAIMGHSAEEGRGGKIAIPLDNAWFSYNRAQGVPDDRWANPRAQRLVSGIVVLSGLINGGIRTNGTVVGRLPDGYRPDTDMSFPVNNGDLARSIVVAANGDIFVQGTTFAASYISLDGIAYPAAGVANWTEVGSVGSGTAYANGWEPYPNPVWGNPRFWKDPYGFVWWAGLIYGGTATVDNAPMIIMPSSLAPDNQTHSKVANAGNFGFIAAVVNPTPALAWKNGSTSNAWISLCGLAIATKDAADDPQNPWINLGLTSGWTRYSTGFPAPAMMRRADGLAVAKGLLKGGSAAPVKVAATPHELWPHAEIILYALSAASFSRVDIRSMNFTTDDLRGAYFVQSGSTNWVSWDNQMWMVGD